MDKWIIFDFDGTVADTLQAGMAIVNALSDRFGYKKVSPEQIRILQDKLPREILKEVGISLWKLPFIARAVRKQLYAQTPLIKCHPGILEALQELKKQNFRLCILTTGSLENAQSILKHNNLESFFEFVHAESNLFGKGRVLKKILAKHRIQSLQAIYVGDEIRDIDSARQAGVKVAAVTWGVNSKMALQKQQPDWLVENPEELPRLLLK